MDAFTGKKMFLGIKGAINIKRKLGASRKTMYLKRVVLKNNPNQRRGSKGGRKDRILLISKRRRFLFLLLPFLTQVTIL